MGFNFFKKNTTADIIYMNGHIFTQDCAYPWATAVAVKDERVLVVGDFEAMGDIVGQDTEVIDLNEQYVFPGFIDAHSAAILEMFEDKYLKLEIDWDLDTVMGAISDYKSAQERDVIFGYGYNEKLLEDVRDADSAHQILDTIESSTPIILLGSSGVHCWFNSAAATFIANAAEEDAIEYPSISYIMSLFMIFDYDETQESSIEISREMADKGVTSYFNMYSPQYFNEMYNDGFFAIQSEDIIRQRFFGSIFTNYPIDKEQLIYFLTDASTSCMEMKHMMNYKFLKLDLSSDENRVSISQEYLNDTCLAVAERGFNIHIDAQDRKAFEMAVAACLAVRSSGNQKSTLVIGSDYQADSYITDDITYLDSVIFTWASDKLNNSVFGHSKNVADAIDNLTTKAAEIIGQSKNLGSIEKGKLADFTVFEENPFDVPLTTFSKMYASMTILGGQIVFDAQEEADSELFDLLSSQRL